MFRIARDNVNISRESILNLVSFDDAEATGDNTESAPEQAPAVPDADPIKEASMQAERILEKAKREAEGILSKAEEKAKAAETALDDAESKAGRITAEAGQKAEEIKKLAEAEGYAKGNADGSAAAEAVLAEKSAESEQAVKRLLEEIEQARNRTFAEMENEVKDLVLSVAKKIIQVSVDENEKIFEALIKTALQKMKPEGNLVIRVSADDFERFFPSGSAVFILENGTTVSATLLADKSLEDWDAVIDSGDQTVNAGLDSQLNYIRLAFDKASAM